VNEVRRALERVEVPGEHEARERAWELVRAAWVEREREPRRLPLRALIAFSAVLAVVGAALSPPGRAVIEEVRDAIGVEEAEPTLFSLPSEGQLLVTSKRGVWVVQRDGSKRLLGRYREASWSPNGRFVVGARANELVALDPANGDLQWSLARPAVRFPRWAGSATDTRIAYLSRSTLRVVPGDGTGDRALGDASGVAPAWRPGDGYQLAYIAGDGTLRLVDADSGRQIFRAEALFGSRVDELLWTSDGKLLVLRSRGAVQVRRADGRKVEHWSHGHFGQYPITAMALRGRTLVYAVYDPEANRSVVHSFELRPGRGDQRVRFEGDGRFDDLAWSPDGRWLLVGWKEPDQWVFLRSEAATVDAVSRISTQFRADAFPTVEGWCCPSNTVSLDRTAAASPRTRAKGTPGNTVLQGTKRQSAIAWRRSASFGLPWAGRLERGVQLPAAGARFFTWDPILKRAPNRGWRRHGTDGLVRVVLGVVDGLAAAHPDAPRIGVGDLSRPNGGDFGVRYGRPGHVSHQNGLDADLYFPRLDRRERPPDSAAQIDRRLAQELVDRFVAAGAVKVFVGPSTRLTGPRDVVQVLPHHDNHLHVRLPPGR
jgi:hypothetical protein